MLLQTRFAPWFWQARLLIHRLLSRVGLEPVLLALLPFAIMAWDPGAFVSPLSIDPWLYFGYYLNLPEFLKIFDGTYYGTRLSTLLPGWMLYRYLPPLPANFVLHGGLFAISLACLYATLRDTVDRRTAFLATFLLGCHPYFLNAVGWDYVDGFGITYLLLTAWLLTAASRSPRWRRYLFAAGASAFALGVANISYFLFVPFLVGHYLVLNRERQRSRLLPATCWFGLGVIGLQVLLGSYSWWVAGRFWFLLPSFTWYYGFANEAGPNPWQLPLAQWWMKAGWLVFPFLGAVGAVGLLGRRCRRGATAVPGIIVYYQVQLLALLLLFLSATWLGRAPMLQFLHYASMLLPATFLALGGQSRGMFGRLSPEAWRRYLVGASILLLASTLIGPAIAWAIVWTGWPPLLLAGLTALAAAATLQQTAGSTRRGLAAVFLLAACNSFVQIPNPLAASVGSPDALKADSFTDDRVQAFRLVAQTVREVQKTGSAPKVWFWYSQEDPGYRLFTMVSSTHLYMYSLLNTEFPRLSAKNPLGDYPMLPPFRIALLSSQGDRLAECEAAVERFGWKCRVLRQRAVPRDAGRFTVTIVEITGKPVPLGSPVASRLEDPGNER
jgi:hypothetical protein